MSTSEEQKRAAIKELEQLLGTASQQPVIELLSNALEKFRSEVAVVSHSPPPSDLVQQPPPPSDSSEVTYRVAGRSKYEQIEDFPGKVEISLLFDNMTKDDVDYVIDRTSLEVKARNVEGDSPGERINLRYSIPHLFREIDKERSSLVLKKDHLFITLTKAVVESWPSVRAKVEPRQKRPRTES